MTTHESEMKSNPEILKNEGNSSLVPQLDQTAVLFGKSEEGAGESLLTFAGPDLVAARWRLNHRSD
jgi:hypothetical protein